MENTQFRVNFTENSVIGLKNREEGNKEIMNHKVSTINLQEIILKEQEARNARAKFVKRERTQSELTFGMMNRT